MKNLIKIIFSLVFLNLIFNVNADAQTVTWQTWYDYGNYDNEGTDVIQTLDGGYIFLGVNTASDANGCFLTKTDQFGSIEWQRLVNETVKGFGGIICYSIQQTIDSGYVLSGGGRDSAVIIKTNARGETDWIRKYLNFGSDAGFIDHKITLDGGIIACGTVYPPLAGYVVKTDSLGNIEWDSIYSTTWPQVIQSRDSNFYFGRAYGLLKTNKYGQTLWLKSYPHGGPSVIEGSDGFIYTGGSAGIDAFYLNKFDTSGTHIFGKQYYEGANCLSMCLSKEGNILLAGYTDSIQQGIVAVVKTDLDGNLIFSKQVFSAFGSLLAFDPYSVKASNDYGFIFTGYTNYPRFTIYRENVFALKTDSNCNAPKFVSITENQSDVPSSFELYQNYPNPFNNSTRIRFKLSNSGIVKLDLYDNNGRLISNIINSYHTSGSYNLLLETNDFKMASGIYYLQMSIRNTFYSNQKYSDIKKIIYIK